MTYWKVLDGTKSVTAASYRYPGRGRWTRHLDPSRLQLCKYGYHVARDQQVLDWLKGPTLWRAEICWEHKPLIGDDKVVTCRIRLGERFDMSDRDLRLFAADCAERALLQEREAGREPDERSWAAIEASRQFANGRIDDSERSAAESAAWSAAESAAWSAAESAAWSAAESAASSVAGSAEREWQYQRFLAYFVEGEF